MQAAEVSIEELKITYPTFVLTEMRSQIDIGWNWKTEQYRK
jgi:hypothetical protein